MDAAPELVERLRRAGCVFAEDEAELLLEAAAGDPTRLDVLASRRCGGEPLEHVVGWAGFAGLRVQVAPGTFVPRVRSELLVAEAAGRAWAGAVVVDLCCGVGAIGAALLARRPDLVVHAADVDPAAVACARRNLPPDRVHEGDLFAALPTGLRGRIDVLVANAPYVPTDELQFLHADAREHEPGLALDGGSDGLDVHRRILGDAPGWLTDRGVVHVEVTASQAHAVADLMVAAGFAPSTARDDELEATVVAGVRQPSIVAPSPNLGS